MSGFSWAVRHLPTGLLRDHEGLSPASIFCQFHQSRPQRHWVSATTRRAPSAVFASNVRALKKVRGRLGKHSRRVAGSVSELLVWLSVWRAQPALARHPSRRQHRPSRCSALAYLQAVMPGFRLSRLSRNRIGKMILSSENCITPQMSRLSKSNLDFPLPFKSQISKQNHKTERDFGVISLSTFWFKDEEIEKF